MTESLVVLLGDSIVGTLVRRPGGQLRFEYDTQYCDRAAPVPLSLSMPARIKVHQDRIVSAWLWGLLPDSEPVLAAWGRRFQVSPSSAFSLLSTAVGEDCPGAVRFASPDGVDRLLRPGSGDITWLSETEVAKRLSDLRRDSSTWLGRTFLGQFSLAGAQAKTALHFRDGRWGVPTGSIPTTHILKPGVAGLDDHDLNEHLCLDAARRAGLASVRTQLVQFGDQSAVVVERYDRIEVDGRIVRVHQEDLCQALGVPPARKYQNEGGPTPTQIVGLFREAMPTKAADDAVQRFVDALAWNWIIGGTDAHAKNYSLLMAPDQVRLAPLYDIASALPYGGHEKKLRLAMKIGGRYDLFPRHNVWPAVACELGLDDVALVDRVRSLAAQAGAAFSDAGSAPAVTALDRELPSRLLDAVADRAARCTAVLNFAE